MSELNFERVAVGDPLPELSIDITAKLIVGAALASRDYQDVHHDREAAQALGSPDIFMNILTTNGLVGRYVTDWCGSSPRLQKVAIRLGAPNYPGDRMVFSGTVSDKDEAGRTLAVTVVGKNRCGNHVTGTVVLGF